MGSLLFQGAFATGLDENEAQSTVEPVRNDPASAELESSPEWNTVESDDSGELVGLSPRMVQSETEFNAKEEDRHAGGDIPDYRTALEGNHDINAQVASSGSAAARESAGQAGHGPIATIIGIEPLNPAQRYGNDYFVVPSMGANELAGEYMQPPQNDNWLQAVAQDRANQNSRVAYRSTQYSSYFGDGK